MTTYRMTRPDLYPDNSIGAKNVKARQGHYVEGGTVREAHEEMRRRFPSDSHFDLDSAATETEGSGGAR